MRSICKRCTILICLLLAGISARATTRKVLFIGNSYTYTNNMPLMLQNITAALGDTLIYDESDPGGYTFMQHSTYAATLAKITSQKWDIVVLQDQSQEPAFPPSQVAVDVYPYAHILDSLVHDNDTCTQTMFMMTWGHANGDPMNCTGYPVICTFDGMQSRLRESYMEMTQNNKATVAPVGAAWKVVHDSFVTPWLFVSDSSHPLPAGSYLEACVLYSSIFHKRTLGCTNTAGLTTADAQLLQRIADRVVMDSLTQWQQYGHYPYAGFNHTELSKTVTFTHIAPVPADHSWDFGDGVTDTASAPVHTYTANGVYTVSHTASTGCFSETIKDVVYIGTTTGVNMLADNVYPLTIMQHGSGRVTFTLPDAPIYDILEVYDGTGRCVKRYTADAHTISDRFVPGFYVVRAYSGDRKATFTSKLIVY
ncbi:MAG: hypothetical protein JWQ38_2113 [Flavipsychrobacter sp.]|nr:hypothetical protein [Flavipsychrobacter sp.]